MKKGFTLIELLAVIVILGMIGLILIPNISKSIETYKQGLLDTQVKNIENAARNWGADNIYLLPTGTDLTVSKTYDEIKDGYEEKYGVLIITLKQLKQDGYIDSEITNPATKQPFDDNLQIYITNEVNKINYEVKMS